jgi:enoyl-CoA hydratase/carnithine racemase
MKDKMPCEVSRPDGKSPYSATLYPIKTAGGNVDMWMSVTVFFGCESFGEYRAARVSLSGQQVGAAEAARLAVAITLAATLAELGPDALAVMCHELTKAETMAYWDERKAAKKSAQEAR